MNNLNKGDGIRCDVDGRSKSGGARGRADLMGCKYLTCGLQVGPRMSGGREWTSRGQVRPAKNTVT